MTQSFTVQMVYGHLMLSKFGALENQIEPQGSVLWSKFYCWVLYAHFLPQVVLHAKHVLPDRTIALKVLINFWWFGEIKPMCRKSSLFCSSRIQTSKIQCIQLPANLPLESKTIYGNWIFYVHKKCSDHAAGGHTETNLWLRALFIIGMKST